MINILKESIRTVWPTVFVSYVQAYRDMNL